MAANSEFVAVVLEELRSGHLTEESLIWIADHSQRLELTHETERDSFKWAIEGWASSLASGGRLSDEQYDIVTNACLALEVPVDSLDIRRPEGVQVQRSEWVEKLPSRPPAKKASARVLDYRVVPLRENLSGTANMVASYLESLIQAEAEHGWEFCNLQSIDAQAPGCGCITSIYYAFTNKSPEILTHRVAVFRRPAKHPASARPSS